MLDSTTYMLYTSSVDKNILKLQNEVLNILAGKIDDFYLAGGTALSRFYLNHRQPDDLDFFSQDFSVERVKAIVADLGSTINKEIILTAVGQNMSKTRTEILVYNIEFAKDEFLKIDFVRDVLELLSNIKVFERTRVLSIEDIYVRKIYTVSGLPVKNDEVGRKEFSGGRQEAKDLFDIYFLSTQFLSLANFINKFCGQILKEGVIRWFRTFDRMQMKIDLTEIKTEKKISFREIDRHLGNEIEKILIEEIEL